MIKIYELSSARLNEPFTVKDVWAPIFLEETFIAGSSQLLIDGDNGDSLTKLILLQFDYMNSHDQ